jgi:hypothetical protein
MAPRTRRSGRLFRSFFRIGGSEYRAGCFVSEVDVFLLFREKLTSPKCGSQARSFMDIVCMLYRLPPRRRCRVKHPGSSSVNM